MDGETKEPQENNGINLIDTGMKDISQHIQTEAEPKEPAKETAKKEKEITQCPSTVPESIFLCLATVTECDRFKLSPDESNQMSEAITQLFGKHLGGWMWWASILAVTVFSKLATVWNCLSKKEKTKKELDNNKVKSDSTDKIEQAAEDETDITDMVEVTIGGKLSLISKQEADKRGLKYVC